MLICPKCGLALVRTEAAYICSNQHSYDLAKSGYVNLMLANQKHSEQPGDEKQALLARQCFLQAGYYQFLAQTLTDLVKQNMTAGQTLLDAGCGSGYYTGYLLSHLDRPLTVYATDISKVGTAMTAKQCPAAVSFVSSVFHLPLADASINGIISVFCPYQAAEFGRILADRGFFIVAGPGPKHLWEMKEAVYQTPYDNPPEDKEYPGFITEKQLSISQQMHLADNQAVRALWMMTPYYHTSSLADSARLLSRQEMDVTAQFTVTVYRKTGKEDPE